MATVPNESNLAHLGTHVPSCEKNLNWMVWLSGLPLARSSCSLIHYTCPILFNLWIAGACFCVLWYPNYYFNQSEVWTTDMMIIWLVYTKMTWLQKSWESVNCYETTGISRLANNICLLFYSLFLIYWFYFAIIMFYTHSEPSFLIQFKNFYMSAAWYFFFSVASYLYYFICVKLLQRGNAIRNWLNTIKTTKPTIDDFYDTYIIHHRAIVKLSKNWNFIIFLGLLLLTFHIPIDLISIFLAQNYFDIPGAIIKMSALAWYIYCICQLNDYNQLVISHLYKYRIFDEIDSMQMIEQFVQRCHLSLDFYGIQINSATVVKILVLLLNLIIPTAYGFMKQFFIPSNIDK